jgi:hypothetical protein
VKPEEQRVINLLLDVALKAYFAMDDTCDDGAGLHWDRDSFDELSDAMDELEELPDDKPDVTMGPAAKAEWALRDLLHQLHNKTDTERIAELERQNAALQAKIDALMLEYCPDEMTFEQKEEWARHQRPVIAADQKGKAS